MNIVRFHEPVTLSFRKSAGGSTMAFNAHTDFVFSNAQLDRIMQDENIRNRTYKVSRLDMMIPNFHVNNVNTRAPGKNRVLVYNGSGGYGDQIVTWPLTLILHNMGYEVHVMTDPGNQTCWWNLTWIKSIHVLPVQHEIVKMFDNLIMFDHVCNMIEHGDNPHPLDLMLTKIGIDPASVPDQLKVVRPQYTSAEMASTMPYRERQIAIYQFASANPVRNLPPQDSAYMLKKLTEAFPQYTWLAIYDEFIPKEYVAACLEDEIDPATKEPKKDDKGNQIKRVKFPNVILLFVPNLRELWALTSQAKVVVSPDSMMVHVAGCQSVPCVGLWGPYSPQSRVKYYQNHFPIHNTSVCPHAPCSHYLATFPKYCPPRQGRNVCECLAAVSPQQVIDGIWKLVPESKPTPPPKT
jgi:ADP-heptose:LPS heptosyltransferase